MFPSDKIWPQIIQESKTEIKIRVTAHKYNFTSKPKINQTSAMEISHLDNYSCVETLKDKKNLIES